MVRRAYPVRTCVGCRKRAPASELLRVVIQSDGGGLSVVPDPSRRLPGRGAHLHVQPDCFDQAVRRRAFGRALRVEGAIEASAVAAHVNELWRQEQLWQHKQQQDPARGDGEAPESSSRSAR